MLARIMSEWGKMPPTASICFARYRAVLEEVSSEVLDHPISVRGEVDGRSDLSDLGGAFEDLVRGRDSRKVSSVQREIFEESVVRQCVASIISEVEQRETKWEPDCRLTVTSAYSRMEAPVARPQRPAPTMVTRRRWLFKVVSTVIIMSRCCSVARFDAGLAGRGGE